ncbi:hypothetical protein BASA50_006879 [Batrachochytrium salamandrivorans]|uniref:Translocation protein sec66 n=1 Tax=Batrachochytrium salamandrivorans TaxID=1357716 RepID=A0ABQ8FA17_9FUNG|nr:hypothetical protein BASA62_009811 [Batrachochytrium salamandrivorans]KAH6594182.1 hypothetical protein BASA50_006879 [Batrachochytrium salamandrivorans]KAH6601655.1 hypothetical protein BASA61_001859 [Batrachochytrium salamandrivorans]KAH9245865.1 hypothetical protein BASA81_016622 [Batrachochytrium salamandrivorans]KAH9273120.1 hypothetical protein BASA83_004698 [Batrachochytrium salamandrivorans]
MAVSSLWLPLVYVSSLAVLFSLFARYNKTRQHIYDQTASYFPLHLAKYEYEELAEQFSPDTENGKLVLTAALAKRAVEDVRRVLKIREEKPPLEQMVREGIVGEDLFDKIVRDERELEAELQQVIEDSEMYREGWGKTIFQEASAIAQSQIQATWKQDAKARMEEEIQERMRMEGLSDAQAQEFIDSLHNDEGSSESSSDDALVPRLSGKLDEEERLRIEKELLMEEEMEKKKASKNNKSGKGKAAPKRKKK